MSEKKFTTVLDYLDLGEIAGRQKFIEDMQAAADADFPFTTEEELEIYNLLFDGYLDLQLVGLNQIDLPIYVEKQIARENRIEEIRQQMLARRNEEHKETYETLMTQLEVLDPENKTEALALAEKIAKKLLESARGTSRGYLEQEVKDFVFVMFNRFRINDFDEFHLEIWAVQQNPVVLKDPEELET